MQGVPPSPVLDLWNGFVEQHLARAQEWISDRPRVGVAACSAIVLFVALAYATQSTPNVVGTGATVQRHGDTASANATEAYMRAQAEYLKLTERTFDTIKNAFEEVRDGPYFIPRPAKTAWATLVHYVVIPIIEAIITLAMCAAYVILAVISFAVRNPGVLLCCVLIYAVYEITTNGIRVVYVRPE